MNITFFVGFCHYQHIAIVKLTFLYTNPDVKLSISNGQFGDPYLAPPRIVKRMQFVLTVLNCTDSTELTHNCYKSKAWSVSSSVGGSEYSCTHDEVFGEFSLSLNSDYVFLELKCYWI